MSNYCSMSVGRVALKLRMNSLRLALTPQLYNFFLSVENALFDTIQCALLLTQLAPWARWPWGRLKTWREGSTSTCSPWTSTRSWWRSTAAVCTGRHTSCMRALRPSWGCTRSGLKYHLLVSRWLSVVTDGGVLFQCQGVHIQYMSSPSTYK